jgi:hypothetical protein
MSTLLRLVASFGAVAIVLPSLVLAAEPPKEGNYDFTSCWSGTANPIAFSKTHSAMTYDMSGATLSNPPGGMFDKGSFHCMGLSTTFDGKVTNTTVCEAIYPDGGKTLTKFSTAADGTGTREVVAGTGKYEDLVSSGTATPLGTFTAIKAGTFQACNHQTGTYKLR